MKIYLLVIFTFLFQSEVFAQWAIPTQMRAENTLDRLSDKGGLSNSDILYGIPVPPGNVVGDYYFDKKWNNATILLYQSETMIEGYPVKYDLHNHLIEIKSSLGIKVLDVRKIKNMVWIDSLSRIPHYFVNGAEYKVEGVQGNGLLEVLVDGKTPLLKRDQLYIKAPTYNVALDAGSRDTKIFHQFSYFYAKEAELYKIKGKKEITAATDSPAVIEEYIKNEKIKVNKESGLIKVFEYINKLQ
jgi:hypothetical protein